MAGCVFLSDERIIALTGASGFIGGHALRALLSAGWRVRALARDPARVRLPAGAPKAPEIVPGSLEDDAALARLLEGAEAVVHLAGLVKAVRPEDFSAVNAQGTARLTQAAARAGARRFVHVSSLAARAPHLSPYAASKRRSEELAREHAGEMRLAILRPPAVYGPGDEATLGLVDQLSRRHAFLPGRAEGRVSLIHVRDLAAAIAALAGADAGGVLEIDDGKAGGYGLTELGELAGKALGRPVRVHLAPEALVRLAGTGADALSRLTGRAFMLSRAKVRELYHPDWRARSPKVEEKVDWTARLGFAEGFLETLRWYCAHGRLPASRLPEKDRQ